MKRIKIIILMICALTLCGCATTKEKPTEELLLKVLKENGITPISETEGYDYADYAYGFKNDEIDFFFLDSKSTNTVNGVFLDESRNLLNELSEDGKKTALSGENWASLAIDEKDTYKFIGLIDDTYVMIKTKHNKKGFVTRIVRALGY